MAATKRPGLTVRVPGGRPAARATRTAPPRPGRDPEGELWSTFGYETVCLLWGLPVKAVQALPEGERRNLARVSVYIDGLPKPEKESLVSQIKRESPTKRLARFRRLARKRTLGRTTA